MSVGPPSPSPDALLDMSECSAEEICQRLRTWDLTASGSSVSVKATQCVHGFAPGLTQAVNIHVQGDLGDFAFMLNQCAEVDVNGNVGHCAGHSLASGGLIVNGNAGDSFGAYATGGIVASIGRAGARCGLCLSGGDVVVRSDVGDEAGLGMTGGTLVLGNSVGDHLGAGMLGGTIYVRGTIKSMAPGVREFRLKEADTMRLSLLLARAGIRAAAKEFRVYRLASTSAA